MWMHEIRTGCSRSQQQTCGMHLHENNDQSDSELTISDNIKN
jgi:hypothetical protein